MGTTSEKLTYLNTTKGKIKDSINLTGANITTEPFRQYSTKLEDAYVDIINNGTDTLYNNFPKVSGEGTSLTLNNTYQAPMRNNLKGNTSQTGTPTPTSPIPVNVVSGDNKVNIMGKNLANIQDTLITSTIKGITFSYNQDGSFSYSGTLTNHTYLTFTNRFYNRLEADTYTISLDKTIGYRLIWNMTYEDGTTDYYTLQSGSKKRTITFSKNIISYYFDFTGMTIGTTYNDTLKLQIEKGDQATDFEPYQGSTYNIDLPVENLFDKNSPNIVNGYLNANGNITTNSSYRVSDYIYIGNYSYITMSGNAGGSEVYCFYDSSKTFAGANSMGSNTSKTISVPSGTSYIRATINANNIDTYMVEKGQKINTYAPYGSAIELCKIGNYQDKFLRSNGTNLAPNNLSSETYNSLQITNNNNGTFTLLGNPTGSFGRDIATNLTLKAGTYTISANEMPSGLYIALDNEADTQLSNGTLSKTFTLASDTTYTSLGIWFTKNKDYDVTIKLMINEGSSASEWQPYGVGEWYLHKEIGKKTLIASDVNSRGTTGTNAYYLATNVIALNDNTIALCMTSMFNYVSFNNRADGNYNIYSQNGTISLRTGDNTSIDWSTLENAKQWVTDNDTIVYYVLATPTSEGIPSNLINQLEEIYIAKSKENQTNISQINNDLGFIISASALKKG